jgi:hypothetical protein
MPYLLCHLPCTVVVELPDLAPDVRLLTNTAIFNRFKSGANLDVCCNYENTSAVRDTYLGLSWNALSCPPTKRNIVHNRDNAPPRTERGLHAMTT